VNLTVLHLRFALEALTAVRLGAQAGGQIRGALWAALEPLACTDPAARRDPAHNAHCPVCRLLALETAGAERGQNPARPLAIRPPLTAAGQPGHTYAPGETFHMGVNLFGDATDVLPYIVQAVRRMGEAGLGYGRGQFVLRSVEALDPLTGAIQALLADGRLQTRPALVVTAASIAAKARQLDPAQATLRFLTPLQITQQGRLLDVPYFAPLIARLLERCQAIEARYTTAPTPQPVWQERYLLLTEQARAVSLVENRTRWQRIETGSRRTNSRNALGGLVGVARYTGDLLPFREWLLWGQSLHVGKNAVKGDGWYELG